MPVRFPVGLLLAGLLALGCTREFDLPKGSLLLGQRCDAAGECSSAFCADGVCCDQRCGGVQVCNLPGSVGTCQDRPLGHGCDGGADCRSGFCSDGVCCEGACTDICHTCAAPGSEGRCALAPDNTDAHTDCGTCAACFSGVCGTAFDGTDPHHDCDAGNTCGYGGCYPSPGERCTVLDGCAVSYCVAYRCMNTVYARIDDYPFLRTDVHRTPLAMASGPGGDEAVLVNMEEGVSDDGGFLGRLASAVSPGPEGPWSSTNIEYTAPSRRRGAATLTGDVAFFAVESTLVHTEENVAYWGYAGIYGQEVQSTGLSGAFSNPDIDGLDPVQMAAASDALGRLTLAHVLDGGDLRVAVRGTDGLWTPAEVRATGASGVAACRADRETQLFYTAGGQLQVVLADGTTESAPLAACEGELHAAAAPDPGGDQVGLVVRCGGAAQLGVFTPGARGAARWHFQPAPTRTPYYGSSNPKETASYPVAEVRPAGGKDRLLLFNALEPGDAPGAPRGGFSQIFWIELDGGLTFTLATQPDNGYRYASFATTSGPGGAPLAAYDFVVDLDGGVPVNNATLLIESYYP